MKNYDQKIAFFDVRSPSKLVYFGAKGTFRKISGSISQKWTSQNSTKGDRPANRQGVESLRSGGGGASTPVYIRSFGSTGGSNPSEGGGVGGVRPCIYL